MLKGRFAVSDPLSERGVRCRPCKPDPTGGSRSTPSTAARTCSRPTRPRNLGATRAARARRVRAGRGHAWPRRSASRRRRPTRLRARAREAAARAGRGLPHRLRGRLRQPPRRRGGRPRGVGGGEVAAGATQRHAAAVHRHPHQAARRRSCASARCARSTSSSTGLLDETGGKLPANFVVTLPKITAPEQVAALADAVRALEAAHGLAAGSLRIELMVETTQSILDERGAVALPRLVAAATRARRRRALRHLRLHRVAATSPRRTSTCATRPATSRST